MAEGIIAVKNTAKKYLKGAADQTIRKRFWLAFARKYGRIKLNASGVDCNWNVKAKEPEIRANGDAGQQTFAEHDAYEQLTIDVRGYIGTDKLSLKKELMNSGTLAIVDLFATKMPDLVKSLRHSFSGELYTDGNATGNADRLLGLESFMADAGAAVAADLVAQPSDTYAGKSTTLANLGGAWSSNLSVYPNATLAKDWPDGDGDSQYDYIAPKLINYTSTSWPGGGATWAENCGFVLRRARTWCKTLGGDDGVPMCHLLSSRLYNEFEDYMETKFRTVTPHKASEDLGFPDTLQVNGSAVKEDFHCPANTGYGINIEEMLLFSIAEDFFYSYGPEWDINSLSHLYAAGFFGNLRFNPKHFARYSNYA